MDKDKDFAGAPNPADNGSVPNITPSEDGIGDWGLEDIADLLESGNRRDFGADRVRPLLGKRSGC
jgi:hypothetical protein